MPRFGPTTRTELIRCLRQLGFQGPYSGGKHQFMVKEHLRVRIPNPHRGDIASGAIGQVLQGEKQEFGLSKQVLGVAVLIRR